MRLRGESSSAQVKTGAGGKADGFCGNRVFLHADNLDGTSRLLRQQS